MSFSENRVYHLGNDGRVIFNFLLKLLLDIGTLTSLSIYLKESPSPVRDSIWEANTFPELGNEGMVSYFFFIRCRIRRSSSHNGRLTFVLKIADLLTAYCLDSVPFSPNISEKGCISDPFEGSHDILALGDGLADAGQVPARPDPRQPVFLSRAELGDVVGHGHVREPALLTVAHDIQLLLSEPQAAEDDNEQSIKYGLARFLCARLNIQFPRQLKVPKK